MIPSNLNITPTAVQNIVQRQQADRTFRIIEHAQIAGSVDDLEAVRQAICVMLSVERYEHLIYSWDFGVELADLIGTDVAYACPTMARRIKEALMQDSRIIDVDGWQFSQSGSCVTCSFTVHTIYGDADFSKEVAV